MIIDPRIRQRRLKLIPWRLLWRRSVVRVRVNDLELFVDVRDQGCGVIMYLNEAYETAESAWLKATLKPGMVVIDVGAHVGYFTTLAARLVGPAGLVIALEPDPHNFRLLTKNIQYNGFRNVRAIRIAAGEHVGCATLFHSLDNHGDHRLVDDGHLGRPLVVPIAPLDEIMRTLDLPHVEVIKIDVQGYEARVIAGAQGILAASSAIKILSEFWPYGLARAGVSAAQFFNDLSRQGLAASLLTEDGLTRPVTWPGLRDALPHLDPEHPDVFINLVWERD